ncbi:MAG: alpha/beta hydrolase [Gammaproteobacteria bacterium]|nr:alpha/beta hydrolase [Gammaproteobacteria bacterium]MDH3431371.1 alpha/beta hydrolase [Gammaproteobacteria bacterium]MDH3434479.1 alpha/beta hydrolase [Gammaproteobacteria bacterium]
MLQHRHQILAAPDGHDIHVQLWQPPGDVTCGIQVVHGLGEHADRYDRFAAVAAKRGYAVCVHDHRGHGDHGEEPFHFADVDGWRKVNADVEIVNNFASEQFPGKPIVLLGHSMGSFIAQTFAMQSGDRLSGLILSASTWPSRLELAPAYVIARIEAWRLGIRGQSALLNQLGFGKFNKPFEPARTEFDWLSRDESEVDKYLSDPLCGGPYTCGLWLDLLGGLLHISSDKAVIGVPSDLPILITGGAADPVGGDKGMTRLAMHYAQTLHQRLRVKVYPDGRHEMLNEINRDEVSKDWLDWVAATTHT